LNEESYQRLSHGGGSEIQQTHQPELLVERSLFHPIVVRRLLSFELHAADSHANPFVELLVKLDACGKVRGEIIRRPSYHSVQFLDHLSIQIVGSTRRRRDSPVSKLCRSACAIFLLLLLHGVSSTCGLSRPAAEPTRISPVALPSV